MAFAFFQIPSDASAELAAPLNMFLQFQRDCVRQPSLALGWRRLVATGGMATSCRHPGNMETKHTRAKRSAALGWLGKKNPALKGQATGVTAGWRSRPGSAFRYRHANPGRCPCRFIFQISGVAAACRHPACGDEPSPPRFQAAAAESVPAPGRMSAPGEGERRPVFEA